MSMEHWHHEIMTQLHRVQSDAIMFITTNTRNRRRIFADPACARIAIETFYAIQQYYPCFLFGFVVMPDHCHFLLLVPKGGSISKMMNVYKRAVAFNVGMGPLWQERFDIRFPDCPNVALRYIHDNPVQEKLCGVPEEYPWSSACGRWDIAELE